MPTGTPDYSKACIYKIWSHLTDRVYIGSTCDMTKRWSQHKLGYKCWKDGRKDLTYSYLLFDSVGVENCKIEWLHDFPCETKKQLNKEEGRIQRQNKDLLINKRIEHGLEMAEYKKIYNDNHKAERVEYDKKYREEHKAERVEYDKKYQEEHKAEKAEYDKKYREEHKAEKAERDKKYQEEHKAERAEYRKKKRALKKEQESKSIIS